MAFENKTISEINDLLISGFEKEFNTVFRLLPKSFIRVCAKVLAGTWITLYKMQAWFFLQIFPETASFEYVEVFGKKINPLIEWGNLIGIGGPSSATVFAGIIEVYVLNNGFLYSGTQLKSMSTGKVYLTSETVTLFPGTVNVPVLCAAPGTAGNLLPGDELAFVSPIGIIKKTAKVTAVINTAVDEEDKEAYRHRVTTRWKMQPQGGALADYRNWAAEVPGIYQTYIYNDDDTATGVLVYVCADKMQLGSRIPSSAMLILVGEACTYNPKTGEARKPLAAVLDPTADETYKNVRAVSEVVFDVFISGYTGGDISSFAKTVKMELQTYFDGREPYIRGLSVDDKRNDKIEKNNAAGIVDDIAISEMQSFSAVILKKDNAQTDEYMLKRGELAALGKVFVNGAKV